MNKALVGLAMGLFAISPALAQETEQEGFITVNIANVANNIAQNLEVNVNQVPVTVQVPIGVAANVCPDVDVAALAKQKQGTDEITCTANSTNAALNQIVQRQIKKG